MNQRMTIGLAIAAVLVLLLLIYALTGGTL
jgi:hypothetical protein